MRVETADGRVRVSNFNFEISDSSHTRLSFPLLLQIMATDYNNSHDTLHVDDDMDDMRLSDDALNPFAHSEPPALAEEAPPPRILDDVERMICHEDFPALLAKATQVKEMRHAMDMDTTPSSSGNMLDPTHVISAVERMKNALSNKGNDMVVVTKGMYPLTDSMLEESFEILQKELERCEEWYDQRKLVGNNKRKAEAIAVKYAKWQTDILMNWMIEHKEHPFPNSQQIQELGDKTGLTHSQIVNWTTNVRKRNLKATVEGGKKPHHFIDFVFLAQDRERRETQGLSPVEAAVKKKKRASSRRKKQKVKTQQYPHAFRPYPGGPVYYQPTPSDGTSAFQPPDGYQPPPPNGGGYHAYYQHPFPPPPPYGHQQHSTTVATNDNWLGSVVSESIDAVEEQNPDTLASFANYWKDDGQQLQQHMPAPNNNNRTTTTTTVQQVDVLAAAASLEHALMADPMEGTPQRDSMNSIEMIDLDDSGCFLDEYDFCKNMTEI